MKKIIFNPNRLKAERIARNLSQEEVAIKLGKNRTWLAKRENGNVDVGADDLAAIATVLKVDDLSIFLHKTFPKSNDLRKEWIKC